MHSTRFASTARLCCLVLLALVLVACRRSTPANVLRVGASPVPHAEILRELTGSLAAEGIELRVVEMNDYVQPNTALAEGELDANFFQHEPYLQAFNLSRGAQLVSVARVHVEPLGVYSRKLRALGELPEGASVAIPNDPTNVTRALRLLAKGGLLQLPAGDGEVSVPQIVGNPKRLVLREIEGAQLPRVLDDVVAAVINTNYVLAASMDPARDALLREGDDSPYANVLVVDGKHVQDPKVQALVRALQSPITRSFLADHYRGALIPAF